MMGLAFVRLLTLTLLSAPLTTAKGTNPSTTTKCSQPLTYKSADMIPKQMRFYLKTTVAGPEGQTDAAECLRICFEELYFCKSVLFARSTGTCLFSYWSDSSCSTDSALMRRPLTAQLEILSCISCPGKITYEARGGSRSMLSKRSTFHTLWETAIRQSSSLGNSIPPGGAVSFTVPEDVETFKPGKNNPAFRFLMPECSSALHYSVYGMGAYGRPQFVHYVSWEASSIEQCAHLCWRQHFCVSALFHRRRCLMSHIRGVCTHNRRRNGGGTSVPATVFGSDEKQVPNLISCLSCQ